VAAESTGMNEAPGETPLRTRQRLSPIQTNITPLDDGVVWPRVTRMFFSYSRISTASGTSAVGTPIGAVRRLKRRRWIGWHVRRYGSRRRTVQCRCVPLPDTRYSLAEKRREQAHGTTVPSSIPPKLRYRKHYQILGIKHIWREKCISAGRCSLAGSTNGPTAT